MKKLTCALLFLCCSIAVAQTEIFRTKINFEEVLLKNFTSSMSMDSTQIYFNASDFNIYAYNKKNGVLNWSYFNRYSSDIAPKVYKNYVFVEKSYDMFTSNCVQLNAKTGDSIQFLNFQIMTSDPVFEGDFMYCTATVPNVGGSVLKYDLKKNAIVWKKFTGLASFVQPYYFKNKIVAKADNDNWFEIDYNGNFLKVKSEERAYVDATEVFVKNYKFLTHDNKEITEDFLYKYKIYDSLVKTKNSNTHTFVLALKQLLVLGNNKKVKLQLDLNSVFPRDTITHGAYSAILATTPESVWLCYQNFLIHYDFINNKLLRKVDLTPWNPHQLILENRTIWLISKNDGEVYGLDFEPDQKIAYEIEVKARTEFERLGCPGPDMEKIEAAKAVEEKFRNKK